MPGPGLSISHSFKKKKSEIGSVIAIINHHYENKETEAVGD